MVKSLWSEKKGEGMGRETEAEGEVPHSGGHSRSVAELQVSPLSQ